MSFTTLGPARIPRDVDVLTVDLPMERFSPAEAIINRLFPWNFLGLVTQRILAVACDELDRASRSLLHFLDKNKAFASCARGIREDLRWIRSITRSTRPIWRASHIQITTTWDVPRRLLRCGLQCAHGTCQRIPWVAELADVNPGDQIDLDDLTTRWYDRFYTVVACRATLPLSTMLPTD